MPNGLGKRISLFAAVLTVLFTTTAFASSKARIVRLSNVQGKVQMDRGAGQGFERAFLNMPVVEGSKLRTGSDGRAEIEFEDGTVLRIVPDSQIDFNTLSLGDDGQKLSALKLVDGTAYVNVRANKGDRLTLQFGRESVTLAESAHLRVNLSDVDATLAVFDGDVHVSGPSGDVQVSKKHSVTFDLDDNDKYAENKTVEQEPYDQWDKQQAQYHDSYASNRTYDPGSPYSYGVSDLNYYGSFSNIPGYGWGWQPFFVNAGWSPFMDGAWVFYPGFGYTWVSAYPWGWLPYMYGSWGFAPGFGWFWTPGFWNTWTFVPRVVNPPTRTVVPVPPTKGHGTVMVGRGLTALPGSGIPRSVKIAPGSAGLGVARGSVQNLDRVAKEISANPRALKVRTEGEVRSAAAPPSASEMTFPSAHGAARESGTSRGASPARQPASRPAPTPHASPPASRPPH